MMDLPITFRVNFGSSLLIEIGVLGASKGHRPYWMDTKNKAITSILGIIHFSGQPHWQCTIWPYLGTVVSNGLTCGVFGSCLGVVGDTLPVCRMTRS